MTPEEYVAVQRAYNGVHSNGAVENDEDKQGICALRLAKLASIHCQADDDVIRVLDAGCRTGYATSRLLQSGFADECLGIDIVPEFVQWATKSHPGEFQVADLHDLPFEDQAFTWVLCTQALEHCHDVPRAARELARVAKRGVYIAVPLEAPVMKEENPSHFTFERDPMFWVNQFAGLHLRWAELIERSFEFFLVRPEETP